MKLFIFILAATLFICPPSYSAMEALSNESLSKVKGSEENNKPNHDPVTEEPETLIPPPSSLDCRIKALCESSEYKKFTFYLKRLEQFSNEQDYPELMKSDEFIFFCSSFAETAKKCREQLVRLIDGYPADTIHPVLNEKNITFYKADDFYNNLVRYRKGTAPLPDLKSLISNIKKCQHNFESTYAHINCKS